MQMSSERPEVEIHMHANCNAWLEPLSDVLQKWNQIMMVYNKTDLGLVNYRLVYFGPVMGFWGHECLRRIRRHLSQPETQPRNKCCVEKYLLRVLETC